MQTSLTFDGLSRRVRPFDYEQITISAAPVGLTAAKAEAAWLAILRFEGGDSVRFMLHGGTPTSSVGYPAAALEQLVLSRDEALGFRAIRAGLLDMVTNVLYYAKP